MLIGLVGEYFTWTTLIIFNAILQHMQTINFISSSRLFLFINTHRYQIVSINDTAGYDGQFMYGGLIDKCRIVDISEQIVEY